MAGDPPVVDPQARQVLLPGGLPDVRDAALVSEVGPVQDLYFGPHRLQAGGRTFSNFHDFRAFAVGGGAMLTPLRPLPAAPSLVTFEGALRLDPTVPVRLMRQATVFGLPCWVPRRLRPAACTDDAPLPGPLLAAGQQLDFDGRMEGAFLIPGGWSDHADGRWTLGYNSDLQLRVAPELRGHPRGVVVEVEAAAFVPRGSGILHVDVGANGSRPLTQWRVSATSPVALRVRVPAASLPADGQLRLRFSTLDPRRPRDYSSGTRDGRLLGLRLLALRVLPGEAELD